MDEPMGQRNEPTTEEIVKALRCEGDVDKCKDCYFENTELGCVLCSGQEIESLAAARLEQLERDLETFKAFHERYAQQTSKKYVEDVCDLTARAEKAEAERDAANRVWREWYDNEGCDECALCRKSKKTCGHFPKGDDRVNGCVHFEINVRVANKCFFNRYAFKRKDGNA